MDVWVVGGEQKAHFAEQKETWRGFQRCIVARVSNGRAQRVFEYCSPPTRTPEEPSNHFTAATFTADTAYLCTPTEVLVCDLPSFNVKQTISHPYFNDLHHVAVSPDGTLYVAVTGLDAVAQLAPNGDTVRLISVGTSGVWNRFSRDTDYRRVPTTKPHQQHPNHVCFIDGEPWVTRFEQRDLMRLTDGISSGPLHTAGIHDGHIRGKAVFITAVDGHVIRWCHRTGAIDSTDLRPVSPLPEAPLGWCRGLLPIDDDHAWVGFTRLRYTALRRNLSWIRHPFRPTEHAPQRASRIALYSLRTPAVLEQVTLEEVGINAVFSIHRVVE